MRFTFRRKDKDKKKKNSNDSGFDGGGGDDGYSSYSSSSRGPARNLSVFPPTPRSAALLARLPPPILRRIFGFVCPNSLDESYETCERSALDNGCMLCNVRDLAHCVAVCRAWRKAAVPVL